MHDSSESILGGAGVVPEQVSTHQTSPSQSPSERKQTRPSDVTKWSKEDVQSWLGEIGLSKLCSPLSNCRGRQLKRMYNDFCSSREKFEERLEKDLGLDYITLSNFTTELEELFD